MTITVHHMGISQSERIVWLCEELGIPYKLVLHKRSPILSPDSLKSLPGNETGKSPFIEDDEAKLTLSESTAISDYIIYRYANGKLALKANDPHFPDYLYWYHYANCSMQAEMVANMFLAIAQAPADSMAKQFSDSRVASNLKHMDDRLKDNKWLAGPEFTAADVMSMYSVTTQRYFGPQVSLAPYPNLLRWIQDCAARPAYQKAMEKGEPEMKLLLGAEAPSQGMMEVNGTESSHWKK